MELIKTVQKQNTEAMCNYFFNLAFPNFIIRSEPPKPTATMIHLNSSYIPCTAWDKIELHGDPTVQEFLDYFRYKYQLDIAMLSAGTCIHLNIT
jgi:ubiquitin-activating enzyme E1